ncbi:hypothetical protein MPSEU_000082100 [Mayamaea pseudoterrestris]|nr:hypothetical protein MPSEU_000082100 [Mayamaea pseudoterrestris]
MTAITALRPPRNSVTSAYLNHLNRKKRQQQQQQQAALEVPLQENAGQSGDSSFPGQLRKSNVETNSLDSSPLASQSSAARTNGPAASSSLTRPPHLFYSESTGTAATCTSCSSGENSEPTDNSVRGRSNTEDDEAAWDLQRHLSTALVLVNHPVQQADLGSYEIGSFDTNAHEYDEDEDDGEDYDEDDVMEDDDDEDSLSALNRLLEETSKRWERNTLLTHREFCRLPNCRVCLSQSEGIIAQQQAEIQALRAKLMVQQTVQQQQQPVDYLTSLYKNIGTPQDQNNMTLQLQQPVTVYDDHEPHNEADNSSYLPIEQIEVYHGDDCNVSVNSGLTNLYPDHQSTTLTNMDKDGSPDGGGNHSLHRPDADLGSVAGASASTPPPHPSTRVRGHAVSLTAADGSVRAAVYSGPMFRGKPHGVGVLKFVESGDVYLGDLQAGRMHGHGTYTFKDSNKHRNRRAQVLKGTFHNNVFTGYANPEPAPVPTTESW